MLRKSLAKAMRREGPLPWLVESVGRLRAAEDPEGSEALTYGLHLAMRGLMHKLRESSVEALPVVQHLMALATAQGLMRRYRLPAFDTAETFLEAWVKTYNVKTKKGKAPGEDPNTSHTRKSKLLTEPRIKPSRPTYR